MTKLGEQVGVTYQQLAKYEHGTNCISAGRLYCLAQALNVAPGVFFEGLDLYHAPPDRRARVQQRMLVNFLKISDRRQRQIIVSLVRALASD